MLLTHALEYAKIHRGVSLVHAREENKWWMAFACQIRSPFGWCLSLVSFERKSHLFFLLTSGVLWYITRMKSYWSVWIIMQVQVLDLLFLWLQSLVHTWSKKDGSYNASNRSIFDNMAVCCYSRRWNHNKVLHSKSSRKKNYSKPQTGLMNNKSLATEAMELSTREFWRVMSK